MVILRGWQPSTPIPRSWRQPGSLRNYLGAIASMGSSHGAPGSPSLPCRVGPLRCTDPSAVLPRVDRVVYLVLAFLINLPEFSSRGGSRGMFISTVRLNEYRIVCFATFLSKTCHRIPYGFWTWAHIHWFISLVRCGVHGWLLNPPSPTPRWGQRGRRSAARGWRAGPLEPARVLPCDCCRVGLSRAPPRVLLAASWPRAREAPGPRAVTSA